MYFRFRSLETMNFFSSTMLRAVRGFVSPILQTYSRSFSTIHQKTSFLSSLSVSCSPTRKLLMPSTISFEQTRAYQPRGVPKLRCKHCYFVTRHGQLFVECTSKKRHRQFQIVGKSRRFKDDLTEGKFHTFVYKDHKHKRFYRFGENVWTKSDLVGDRMGKDL